MELSAAEGPLTVVGAAESGFEPDVGESVSVTAPQTARHLLDGATGERSRRRQKKVE